MQEHKFVLFADDLLPFLTYPLISTPNLLPLLKIFGRLSGLEVNVAKSAALNISVLKFIWGKKAIDVIKKLFSP